MSEKDLELKASARRLSWQRGFSTRINVPLRVYVDKKSNTSGFEEFTDLDVLAVHVNPEGRVGVSIYDCKTSAARSTERTFWLRGLADFFGADMAWLVREEKVTAAARQLATRLEIGVMNREDLQLQLTIDRNFAIPMHSAYERLFTPADISQQRQRMSAIDRRLSPLVDYLHYDYWVEDSSSNLSLLIANLAGAARYLNPKDPTHISLLWDSAWLYLLALARAAEYVRLSHSNNPELSLPEYFLGGQAGIRSKQLTAKVFEELTGSRRDNLLPAYYPNLLELFGRLYVHPTSFVGAMRYCEVLVATLCAGKRTSLDGSAGDEYDVVTAKLLLDTANFLIGAAGLVPSFRQVARDMTMRAPILPPPSAEGAAMQPPKIEAAEEQLTIDSARTETADPPDSMGPESGVNTN
jgi:hypothetical protein